jgi:hypothetical protein
MSSQRACYGKCHRKYTADRLRALSVRVKRCGKSAPRPEQSGWQGKPHVEQDQIGEEEWPAPSQLPGRSLEPASNGGPRGMVATCFGRHRNRLIDRAGPFSSKLWQPFLAPSFVEWLPPASHRHRNRLIDRAGPKSKEGGLQPARTFLVPPHLIQ